MKVVVDLYYDDRCPDFDWHSFADLLRERYLRDFDPGKASANMFNALAILANALERWDDAYAYAERSLALNSDDVQSLLMQLHFAAALEKNGEVQFYRERLQDLNDRGRLNRSQQDTLALYLEI